MCVCLHVLGCVYVIKPCEEEEEEEELWGFFFVNSNTSASLSTYIHTYIHTHIPGLTRVKCTITIQLMSKHDEGMIFSCSLFSFSFQGLK